MSALEDARKDALALAEYLQAKDEIVGAAAARSIAKQLTRLLAREEN